MKNLPKELAIYQGKDGEILLREDKKNETIWANLDQISVLFNRDKSVISRHIKNIFKEEELKQNSTVAFFTTVQKEGKREVKREIEYFNLDMIISVGYRVNSKIATQFRIWATKTLKQHITKGFTINKNILQKKQNLYLQVLEDIKLLAKNNQSLQSNNILDLIRSFSYTWFSLDSYDKDSFPKKGTKKSVQITAKELLKDLKKLKKELILKNQATDLFAQERQNEALHGIVGNILQAVFDQDAYPTLEEKAAHLLYFIIKTHPFIDGNKRSGAFTFIWFMQKAGLRFQDSINPETLTALTILIAESNQKDKEKMIGIVLLLLNFKKQP